MKITHMVLAVGVIGVGATLFSVGCGSAPSVTCSVSVAGFTACETITVPSSSSATQDDLNTSCTSGGGKVVDSCPTAGLIGTCSFTLSGYNFAEGYYGGTAAADEAACKAGKGTWKAK